MSELGKTAGATSSLGFHWQGWPIEPAWWLYAISTYVSCFAGGFIPVGGASAFASAMIPLIEAGGGAVVTQADVSQVLLSSDNSTVVGIQLANGQEITSNTVRVQAAEFIWAASDGRFLPSCIALPAAARTKLRPQIMASAALSQKFSVVVVCTLITALVWGLRPPHLMCCRH